MKHRLCKITSWEFAIHYIHTHFFPFIFISNLFEKSTRCCKTIFTRGLCAITSYYNTKNDYLTCKTSKPEYTCIAFLFYYYYYIHLWSFSNATYIQYESATLCKNTYCIPVNFRCAFNFAIFHFSVKLNVCEHSSPI